MTISFEQVVAEVDVSGIELRRWISERWLLPTEQDGRFAFDDVDLARARLIVELRQDLSVNDEAVPVILQLLDQVYELRRALGDLHQAIETLPAPMRRQIDANLRGDGSGASAS